MTLKQADDLAISNLLKAEKDRSDLVHAQLRQRHSELVHQLELLTPGGSEFHGDPNRCISWIKDRLSGPFASVKQENEQLKQRTAELERQLAAKDRELESLNATMTAVCHYPDCVMAATSCCEQCDYCYCADHKKHDEPVIVSSRIDDLQNDLAAHKEALTTAMKNTERLKRVEDNPGYLRARRTRQGTVRWSFRDPFSGYEFEEFDSAAEAIDAQRNSVDLS